MIDQEEEILNRFDQHFCEEMNKRLNQKTLKELGKMPIFIWSGTWMAEELIKRKRFKERIYDETTIEVLTDPKFREYVASYCSYKFTGKGTQIEIAPINTPDYSKFLTGDPYQC